MCAATLWLTAADSVQDLHLIPFSLQPKLQHQWILLQSYNKWAEKQQACLNVFPECHRNLSKVTTNERKNNKLAWMFFPNATVTYLKLQQMRQKRKRKTRFSFPVTRLFHLRRKRWQKLPYPIQCELEYPSHWECNAILNERAVLCASKTLQKSSAIQRFFM